MFKRAQIRFIAVTMAIVLIIFAFFFGASYLIFRSAYTTSIMDALAENEEAYFAGSDYFDSDILIISFTDDDLSSPHRTVTGESLFTKEQIDQIIQTAKSYNNGSGSVGEIYFLVCGTESEALIIASQMTNKREDMRHNLLVTLGVLLFVLTVVFIVVIFSSYNVIRPLKQSFYTQQQFVSDASHELRTPLTIISANADVLKNVSGESVYLQNIITQTERLSFLVSDMLTLAKNQEEKSSVKEDFSLTEEVISATLPYEAVLFEAGKTLITDIDDNIQYLGDREAFKTLIGILLDNAAKHSSPKATVKVDLKKEGNHAILTVFNTGSKVQNQDSARVFERFYRGDDSRSRESGGCGLGLAIAKNICDRHKWRISAKSEYGKCMTITVIL